MSEDKRGSAFGAAGALLLALAMLLASCAAGPEPVTDPGEAEAAPPPAGDISYLLIPSVSFAETETAYIGKSTEDLFLHYYDNDGGGSGILCGRPDCPHNGADCGGYVGISQSNLLFYDGLLWWVGYDVQEKTPKNLGLYRMKPDASGRQAVFTDPLRELYASRSVTGIRLHKGFAWIYGMDREVEDAVPYYTAFVYRVPLGETWKPELVMEKRSREYHNGFPGYWVLPVEDGVYMGLRTHKDETYGFELYRYDLETGLTEDLLIDRETGLYAYGLWIDPDGGVFITGNRDNVGAVFTLTDGKLTQTARMSAGDFSYRNPFALNGAAVSYVSSSLTGVRRIHAVDYEGKTLYEGPWAVSPLDSGAAAFGAITILGGDRNGFIVSVTSRDTVFARYEIKGDRLEETILW